MNTVGELIQALQAHDPNRPVEIADLADGYEAGYFSRTWDVRDVGTDGPDGPVVLVLDTSP